MICDFSQYCGTTSAFYGVDMGPIGQTAVFDGSLRQNDNTQDSDDDSTLVEANVAPIAKAIPLLNINEDSPFYFDASGCFEETNNSDY